MPYSPAWAAATGRLDRPREMSASTSRRHSRSSASPRDSTVYPDDRKPSCSRLIPPSTSSIAFSGRAQARTNPTCPRKVNRPAKRAMVLGRDGSSSHHDLAGEISGDPDPPGNGTVRMSPQSMHCSIRNRPVLLRRNLSDASRIVDERVDEQAGHRSPHSALEGTGSAPVTLDGNGTPGWCRYHRQSPHTRTPAYRNRQFHVVPATSGVTARGLIGGCNTARPLRQQQPGFIPEHPSGRESSTNRVPARDRQARHESGQAKPDHDPENQQYFQQPAAHLAASSSRMVGMTLATRQRRRAGDAATLTHRQSSRIAAVDRYDRVTDYISTYCKI